MALDEGELSQTLVVTQIAVSLLLLVAAGLLTTLAKLTPSTWVHPEKLLFSTSMSAAAQPDEMSVSSRTFTSGSREFPASATPQPRTIMGRSLSATYLTVPGYTGNDSSCAMLEVASNFFETMQIPIQLGRPIDTRDVAGAARVAVVNEVFAKRFFPEQSPVGRRFIQGRAPNTREYEIVGVARNTRYNSLKGEVPAVAYLPYTHDPRSIGSLTFDSAPRATRRR